MDMFCDIEFIAVSSYRAVLNRRASQDNKALDSVVEGRHVIIVEDILDTGLTLGFLKEYVLGLNPPHEDLHFT